MNTKNIFCSLLLSLSSLLVAAQHNLPDAKYSNTKLSTYLSAQYNQTLYDETKGNNPWAVGLGLQALLNNTSKWKPTIDFTADIYLEDDKTYSTINGIPVKDARRMVNLFAGSYFKPSNRLFVCFAAGTSFIGGQTFFGIKPSLGVFFSQQQRWSGKLSYINIFNREKITNSDFGSLSFSLGIKLF